MGQVHCLPVAIVKANCAGGQKGAGLLEAAGAAVAEAEVLDGIVGVTKVEAPAEVEQEPLAVSAGC